MMRERFSGWIRELQDRICEALEQTDGRAKFEQDIWQREGGGGGITRIIRNGNVFEKGGVNTSEVYGELNDAIRKQLGVEGESFFACGISLVIHPFSPMVPTVHANFRYFEVYDKNGNVTDGWFGGGSDLTPYILFEADAIHFHQCLKTACDQIRPDWYADFKLRCDGYFVNHHRESERRGIGGIFYDHMRPAKDASEDELFRLAQLNGQALMDAYIPIVNARKGLSFTEADKNWQLLRRGRYVEFNLIHDRGTLFGLRSNGRTESILMSLPMHVKFDYMYQPQRETEKALQEVLMNPKNWIS
jgi:coproporphyrinogen III oxidase